LGLLLLAFGGGTLFYAAQLVMHWVVIRPNSLPFLADLPMRGRNRIGPQWT
jgi:hypothetical protein